MAHPERLVLAIAAMSTLAGGCGRSVSQADLERAREAVRVCLAAWQEGVPVASVRVATDPVLFSDDAWQSGQRLVSFAVTSAAPHPDDKLFLCSAHVVLQDRAGKQAERDIYYRVDLQSPIAVGRDPYY
jgi:hypothetical protein